MPPFWLPIQTDRLMTKDEHRRRARADMVIVCLIGLVAIVGFLLIR